MLFITAVWEVFPYYDCPGTFLQWISVYQTNANIWEVERSVLPLVNHVGAPEHPNNLALRASSKYKMATLDNA